MSNENTTFYQDSIQIFQLELTKSQHKAFSKVLPPNHSLEPVPKTQHKPSSRPQKKLITNEGNIVLKSIPQAQSQASPRSQVSESLTTSSIYWENPGLPARRSLRDHRNNIPNYVEESFEQMLPAPTTSSKTVKRSGLTGGLKSCSGLLQKLKKHKCAAPFLKPVDVVGLGLIDYYDVVKEPMDLSTVEKKLRAKEYSTIDEFAADVRKIWNNAFKYNLEGSLIYQMTTKMKNYFEKLLKEVRSTQSNDKVTDLEKKIQELNDKLNMMRDNPAIMAAPQKQHSRSKVPRSSIKIEEPMTVQEKKILCENIRKMSPDALKDVWQIIITEVPEMQENKEELVFDVDALPVKVARDLERYVKNKMRKPKQNKKEVPVLKPSFTVDLGGFEPHAQQGYSLHLEPKLHDAITQNTQQTQATSAEGKSHLDITKKKKEDTADSQSSDSSFISDSDSDFDDEKKHAPKGAQNSFVKKQELDKFQPGNYGSMLNSFVLK